MIHKTKIMYRNEFLNHNIYYNILCNNPFFQSNKEKHCGTTGSISLSFKSPNQQYPPLTNQSAIFVFCVHVSIMGLITCIDHLTISVVAMTCANNEVVYYWQEPIKTCPSAFCVIGVWGKI